VLDAGCGTGENALAIAARGLSVLAVDVAASAVASGQAKAESRGLPVTFLVADALDLGRLGQSFESVLDCGLFHTFDDAERVRYVAGLASVVASGGTLHLLCFNDTTPGDGGGPRRVSRVSCGQLSSMAGLWSRSSTTGTRRSLMSTAYRPGWPQSAGPELPAG
jgi:cyclopropane fatty-acyl-phospholipid synthase-like methyltransferase